MRIHADSDQDVAPLVRVPRVPTARTLVRFAAFLFALLLLQVLLSCKDPSFRVDPRYEARLATLKTFCIDDQPDPELYIWNMRTIAFEELKPLVAKRLVEKGYRLVSPREAECRLILTTFTEEPTPRYRITILEAVERTTSRKLWSGRIEIPYEVDLQQGGRNLPALEGLLDLIPPPAGAALAASDSTQEAGRGRDHPVQISR